MFQNYFKIALKVLMRRKFFTAINLLVISLTLSVLIALTTMIEALMGSHEPEPPELLIIANTQVRNSTSFDHDGSLAGYRLLTQYAQDLPGIERMAITEFPSQTISFQNQTKTTLMLRRTDARFWQMMNFEFLEGAAFNQADYEAGKRFAIINEATRNQVFSGQSAVGQMLDLNGTSFQVIGVVRNIPDLRILSFGDVWVPISTHSHDGYRHDLVGNFVGLLQPAPDADIHLIKQAFQQQLQSVQFHTSDYDQIRSRVFTGWELVYALTSGNYYGDVNANRLHFFLTGVALLFMALPALNLVNLNVSRMMERASEIGVRKTFGASSGSLVGQFVFENVFLTVIGGVLGFGLATVGLGWLESWDVFRYTNFQINSRILGFAMGFTLFFGLLSGIYPAWKMSKLHPVHVLSGRVA